MRRFVQGATNSALGPASTSQPSFRPQPPPPSRKPPAPAPKPNTESAIVLAGDAEGAITLTGNGLDPGKDYEHEKGKRSHSSKMHNGDQAAVDQSDAAEPSPAENSNDDAKSTTTNGTAKTSSAAGQNAVNGPKPPPGPAPPASRPPNGPRFNGMPGGMQPMDGPMGSMMGMSGPMGNMMGMSGPMGNMMGMSGPMGPMPMFNPGFPQMAGPFPMGGPMMPMGGHMGGHMGGPMGGPMMPHPMMMGGMPGPMMDPMGRPFMPDFGSGNFGEFGDRSPSFESHVKTQWWSNAMHSGHSDSHVAWGYMSCCLHLCAPSASHWSTEVLLGNMHDHGRPSVAYGGSV